MLRIFLLLGALFAPSALHAQQMARGIEDARGSWQTTGGKITIDVTSVQPDGTATGQVYTSSASGNTSVRHVSVANGIITIKFEAGQMVLTPKEDGKYSGVGYFGMSQQRTMTFIRK